MRVKVSLFLSVPEYLKDASYEELRQNMYDAVFLALADHYSSALLNCLARQVRGCGTSGESEKELEAVLREWTDIVTSATFDVETVA